MSGFGTRLREARLAQQLSLVELAAMLGVTYGAISKWETGQSRPRLKRLVSLSQCLKVTPESLLEFEEDSTPEEILRVARAKMALALNVPLERIDLSATVGRRRFG